MNFKSLAKDTVLFTVPSLLGRGIALISIPIYTRVLSPKDYGLFDLIIVFASLINLTVSFEVSQAVARFYTVEKDTYNKRKYFSTALWFTVLCYTVFFCFCFIYRLDIANFIFQEPGHHELFAWGLVYVWLNGIYLLVQNQFRWDFKSDKFALTSITFSLVSTFSGIYLAYVLDLGLLGFLFGLISGVLVSLLLSLYFLRESFELIFDFNILIKMLKFSVPLVPSGIAVFVMSYTDRLMISSLMRLEDLGIYSISFRLSSVVGLAMVGFQMAITPLIYAHYESQDTPKNLAKIFSYFLFCALLILFSISALSQVIIVFITTPEYHIAYETVSFLVFSIIISQMYIFAPGINIRKKTGYVLLATLSAAVCNFLLNFILIPFLGLIGAAIATLFSSIVLLGVYLYFGQKLYPIPYRVFRIMLSISLVISSLVLCDWLSGDASVDWYFFTAIFSLLCLVLPKILDIKVYGYVSEFFKNRKVI